MSIAAERGTEAPASGTTPPKVPGSDWSLSWQGVRTVTQLELRQRIRSTRWKVALVVWFVAVGLVTLLTSGAVSMIFADPSMGAEGAGRTMFGVVVFFVLFLGLLVAPALTAPAINGDRSAGTLATLQATLLTPAEIVVGKLLSAWLAALAFLAASVPFILWAFAVGGLPFWSLVSVLVVLGIVLGIVCAVGLGFSTLTAKTSGSAVLTYLTVGGLSVLTLVLFGLSVPLVTTTEQVRTWDVPVDYDWEDSAPPECEWRMQEQEVFHSERTWWLLAANPFVIVADAQPLPGTEEFENAADPLTLIQYGVRYARTGPAAEQDWCGDMWFSTGGDLSADPPVEEPQPSESLVWPWGLGIYLLLGAGGVVTAVRRLRIPAQRLPKGTRVA
ncbi:ABC transporter permease subunit [Isoptericola halotolerans]|uniref:ABC-type transport system involved in multi-copper enzyme maturation permease subunit n=1 Tax=Isoptericola halotolerans TaxID=300560 RepID=A0ABX2A5Q7_9MICO|nr:ABC transporter permease subunit [Isoptericola halotolerans]NOV97127.1 ABC-type transport system involved in multi-copper enzyme maturation permease subunit [Isoptericola halotolerans]